LVEVKIALSYGMPARFNRGVKLKTLSSLHFLKEDFLFEN
jgi:hypothetical protein